MSVHPTGPAARRWTRLQRGRGIPPEILANASRSPWSFDPAHFAAPADAPDSPSRRAALAMLGSGGTVLDVGCGGGAAAFALADRATHVTGNDVQNDMLDLFAATARDRGIPYATVPGRWPDAAADTAPADVVVCHLVVHNVVELSPFVTALTAAARRGVVVEMLEQHPMAWLDPLWVQFHGLHRPPPATTDDALAVLDELGIAAEVHRWERPRLPPQDPAVVTQRLCLPDDRIPDVAEALAGLERPGRMATVHWRP